MGEPAGTQENPTWTPLDFWSQFEPKVAKKLQAIQKSSGKTNLDRWKNKVR